MSATSTVKWASWPNPAVAGGSEQGGAAPDVVDEHATARRSTTTLTRRTVHMLPPGTADAREATGSTRAAYDAPMRGDRVEIVVDIGTGVQTFEVVATRAGRRVDVSTGRGVVEVSEVTRGGTVVRTARFMNSRVVAVVEHPA